MAQGAFSGGAQGELQGVHLAFFCCGRGCCSTCELASGIFFTYFNLQGPEPFHEGVTLPILTEKAGVKQGTLVINVSGQHAH